MCRRRARGRSRENRHSRGSKWRPKRASPRHRRIDHDAGQQARDGEQRKPFHAESLGGWHAQAARGLSMSCSLSLAALSKGEGGGEGSDFYSSSTAPPPLAPPRVVMFSMRATTRRAPVVLQSSPFFTPKAWSKVAGGGARLCERHPRTDAPTLPCFHFSPHPDGVLVPHPRISGAWHQAPPVPCHQDRLCDLGAPVPLPRGFGRWVWAGVKARSLRPPPSPGARHRPLWDDGGRTRACKSPLRASISDCQITTSINTQTLT